MVKMAMKINIACRIYEKIQAAGVENRVMRMREPEMERQQEVRANCRLYTLQRGV
jgi:hypothetical protein